MATEPSTWSSWASGVAGTLSAVKGKLVEFLTARYSDPRFFDDIVLEIVSYLDIPDAARAARVCSQWRPHAMRAAYTHIILHCETRPSVLLVETLSASEQLRSYIQHITIIHCFPAANLRIYRSMYAWMDALPEGSLRTFRAVADTQLAYAICTLPAVRTCPDLFVLGEAPDRSGKSERHRHRETTQIAFLGSPPAGFSSRFILDWRRKWSPARTVVMAITVAFAPRDPGARLQQLRDLLTLLLSNTSRQVGVWLAVGHQQITADSQLWSTEIANLVSSRVIPIVD